MNVCEDKTIVEMRKLLLFNFTIGYKILLYNLMTILSNDLFIICFTNTQLTIDINIIIFQNIYIINQIPIVSNMF